MTSISLLLFLACAILANSQAPPASTGGEQCAAITPSTVQGFSVFHCRPEDHAAFVQELQNTIKPSRGEPGNLMYYMFTDPTRPQLIGYFESYVDENALYSHILQPYITDIFQGRYYLELNSKGADLYGPWLLHNVDEQDEIMEMVFYWEMNCTNKYIWDIITNFTDASWIPGSPTTTIVALDENGQVIEGKEVDPDEVDPLGPYAQRRTWEDTGNVMDVRKVYQNESTFTFTQTNINDVVFSFADVVFYDYNVTFTLDTEGVDPDSQSRGRYHVQTRIRKGDLQEGREVEKQLFYNYAVDHYQTIWNCTQGVFMSNARKTVQKVHKALEATADVRSEMLDGLYEKGFDIEAFVDDAIGDEVTEPTVVVKVATPLQVTPDLQVVAVEDIMIQTLLGADVSSRITIYQINEWARIVSVRVFDEEGNTRTRRARELVRATNKYYNTLEKGRASAMERLFARKSEVHCPAGYAVVTPEKAFETFYASYDSFDYTRSKDRTFVDSENRETAQLIKAEYVLANKTTVVEYPVDILTFDRRELITKLESF